MESRKLPIGIQSFEKLREDNYLYVDKTEYIWNLVQNGTVYFLSRPRRFGKSLLTSTLEAYFQGRKELFKGLYIDKKEKDWIAYPVIHIDFTGGEYQSETGLNDMLENTLVDIIRQYDLTGDYSAEGKDVVLTFKNTIQQIYRKTGKQVVVLVDEYDKPLLETMEINSEQEEKNKQLFKSFFGVLKGMDAYLKFEFFTGVTKFSKVSIFSDLNHLEDISLTEDYACICGITEEEMLQNFQPEINALSERLKVTHDECVHKLAEMYDGYHFSADGAGVYNPFSLINCLKQKALDNYWFETEKPTFLIRMLQSSGFTPETFEDGIEAQRSDLSNVQSESMMPIAVSYQAGYLTITGYNDELEAYVLGFPNNEVKYGFLKALVPFVLGEKAANDPLSTNRMALDLKKGKIDSFMTRLESLFSGVPYIEGQEHKYEQEWRNEIYLVLAMTGQKVMSEVHTSQGRADCIVETDQYIYLFEFKVDKSAEEALKQIEEKEYAKKYKADTRKLYKIGVNFSSEKRNIKDYKVA